MKNKKTNMRIGVFETNSSSTHSVCIPETFSDEDDMLDVSIPDEDGNIVLNGGEFDWDYEKHTDAYTKACYLAIYCKEYYSEDEINGQLLIDILISVIKEQTKCDNVIFNFSGEYDKDNWSYIDHQSCEDKDYHWMFNDKETIRNFIFNKESELIIDNDNH